MAVAGLEYIIDQRIRMFRCNYFDGRSCVLMDSGVG